MSGEKVVKKRIKVRVQVDVQVDPQVWADTYGLEYSDYGAARKALRDDIANHVTAIVREAASEAVERIAAGAEVKEVSA